VKSPQRARIRTRQLASSLGQYAHAHIWRYPAHLKAQLRDGFSHLRDKGQEAVPEDLLDGLLEAPAPPSADVDAWTEYQPPQPAKRTGLVMAALAALGALWLHLRRRR
jgi:hypothetical protein